MKFFLLLTKLMVVLAACLIPAVTDAQGYIYDDIALEVPARTVGAGEVEGTILLLGPEGEVLSGLNGDEVFIINTIPTVVEVEEGRGNFVVRLKDDAEIAVYPRFREQLREEAFVDVLPGWLSILPPLIAIVLALLLHEVIISLFIGIFIGLLLLYGFEPSAWLQALFRFVDTYLLGVLTEPDHQAVILFSLLIGGMVNLITRNGGMAGLVKGITRYASSGRRTQLITWLLGVLIFFDDYANTLIVGNTMRPLTDRYRVSREKLAYIVDSTAAPVASIAFLTTWIGAELGYIEAAITELGLETTSYAVFLNSLEYAFYPVLALLFMLFLILFKKDFGPMLRVEQEAKASVQTEAVEQAEVTMGTEEAERQAVPWLNAVLPILLLLGVAFGGMLYTGYDEAVWHSGEDFLTRLATTIGNADAYKALLWASLVSLIVALLMTIGRRLFKLQDTMDHMLDGVKGMMPPIVILILAWVLAQLTEDLNTAGFITSLFGEGFSPIYLPALVFLLSAAISFATGSSWGTMAILYPLMLPVSYQLAVESGMPLEEAMEIFYEVTAVVLAGSVFGDHCSPISDTTILSSLSSSCNHITHVRTQLPYAVTVALVALLLGHLLLTILGVHWLLIYFICAAVLLGVVLFFGKNSQ